MILTPRLKLERPLNATAVHLCIDMQALISTEGPWPTRWLQPTLSPVVAMAERFAPWTIFTRFIPPQESGDLPGAWGAFYQRWHNVTRDQIDPELLRLVEPLGGLVPPARVFDKTTYSAFVDGRLHRHLQGRQIDTLIVSGAETEVCVLATVLAAVDLGYRVILVMDAICSSSDQGHDALLSIMSTRFHQQIELATTEIITNVWWS